ncbi:MAG: hypothetical protein MJ141_04655 [Clostridia bacterium]|nr:hypothetical protein [Clostridia bacterium]
MMMILSFSLVWVISLKKRRAVLTERRFVFEKPIAAEGNSRSALPSASFIKANASAVNYYR